MGHKKALVLNADYTPIGLVKWQKAITLEFKGLVNVIDFYSGDKIVCTDGIKWPAPAVVACTKFKYTKGVVPFSRKNVFIRDKLTCQYCGKQMHFSKLTFDHVIPRSKFKKCKKFSTPTHWENIVTCCYPCNLKKGNKTLEKSGMQLLKDLVEPSCHGFVKGIAPWTALQEEWIPYLPKSLVDLCRISEDD